jgi:hypothetical protein
MSLLALLEEGFRNINPSTTPPNKEGDLESNGDSLPSRLSAYLQIPVSE